MKSLVPEYRHESPILAAALESPILAVALAAVLAGCASSGDEAAPGATGERPRAFVGATIIDGTGGPAIADGVLIVGSDGRIAGVGAATDVTIPEGAERVDLSGKFVMPGLINAHGHVGDTRGLEAGQYSRDNVLRQLGLYARYGVTTVLSLGGDGEEGVAVRDEQDDVGLDRARLFLAGTIVTGSTEDEAREMVDGNAALGADFIKIRVDDNLGTTEKMSPAIYAAVIDRAHELEMPVAAHLFYLEDAKGLLDANVDFIVHSVRDTDVDDEFARKLIENEVCYTPTLAREVTTFVYEDIPEFFDDPFFLAEADVAVLEQLRDPARQERIRNSASARAYKTALVQAQRNVKTLSDAGVTIAMGTDTGPPGRFQGFYEHVELALMAEAGLSPAEILVASTGNAARCIGRDDIGTIAAGNWADFLVLEDDPLADIANVRSIESVWISGNEVPGRTRAP
ncbi:MAG: amidohydrolase family protein [Gemmatimonadota bacterium]